MLVGAVLVLPLMAQATAAPLILNFNLSYLNATGDEQVQTFSDAGLIPEEVTVTNPPSTPQTPVTTPTAVTKKTNTVTKKTATPTKKPAATATKSTTPTTPAVVAVTDATPNGGLTGAEVVDSETADAVSTSTSTTSVEPLSIRQVPIPSLNEQASASTPAWLFIIIAVAIIAVIWWVVRRRKEPVLTAEGLIEETRTPFRLSPRLAVAVMAGLAILIGWRVTRQQTMADTMNRADNGKYAINVGWNDPSLDYLLSHKTEVATVPMDGLILGANSLAGTGNNNLLSRVFSNSDLTLSQFSAFLNGWSQLKELPSLRHSLARVNTASRYMPFDDAASWETHVLNNWRVAAQLVKQAGLEGFFLDTEVYKTNPSIYDYPTTYQGVDLTTLPFDQVQTLTAPLRQKAEERGRQMATILNEEFPDRPVDVLFSITASHFVPYGGSPEENWAGLDYELFPSFIDGFVMGAGANVKLYDGYERSYPIKSAGPGDALTKYRSLRPAIASGAEFSRYPQIYQQKMGVGLAMWLDYAQSTPWHYQRDGVWYRSYVDLTSTPTWMDVPTSDGSSAQNYFPPSVLTDTLGDALRTTDKYVWMYNQRPDIWGSRSGQATWNMPLGADYQQALLAAHDQKSLNTAPVWYDLPTQTILTGHLWQQTVTSSLAPDADGDAVAVVPANLPADMRYNSATGVLSWMPRAGVAGNQNVQLKASDGLASSIATINLTVQASAPQISHNLSANRQSLRPGDTVSYSLQFANEGNDLARSVVLRADLPGRLTVVSGATVADGRLSVSLGDLAPQETREVAITLRLD